MRGADSGGKGNGGLFASVEDICMPKKGMTNADFINGRKHDPLLVIGLCFLILGISILLFEYLGFVSSNGVLLRWLETMFNVSVQRAYVKIAISQIAWALGLTGLAFLAGSFIRTRRMPPALEIKRRVLRILCNECKSYFKFGEEHDPRALRAYVRPVKGYALVKSPYIYSSELLIILRPHIKSLGCIEMMDCADRRGDFVALLFEKAAKSRIMDGRDWRVR